MTDQPHKLVHSVSAVAHMLDCSEGRMSFTGEELKQISAVADKQRTMTEDDILSSKPFTQVQSDPTIESLAGELVDTLMIRLQTIPEFGYVMKDMAEEKKRPIDNDLMRHTLHVLRSSPLLKKEAPKVSGQPLEPETDGQVFQVQVGGSLLISEQVKS